MKKVTQILVFSSLFVSMLLAHVSASAQNIKPDADNAGLTLPKGFAALKVADNLGRTRHIVVNKQGAIYAKLERLDNGKGIVVLKDTDGDGMPDAWESKNGLNPLVNDASLKSLNLGYTNIEVYINQLING